MNLERVLQGVLAASLVVITMAAVTLVFSGSRPVLAQVCTDGTRPVACNDPNNEDEKKDLKGKNQTAEQRRQNEKTNKGGHDDDHTEGNVVEVNPDDHPPTIVIANRDGLVTLKLYKDAADEVRWVKVGSYIQADGAKNNEQDYDVYELGT